MSKSVRGSRSFVAALTTPALSLTLAGRAVGDTEDGETAGKFCERGGKGKLESEEFSPRPTPPTSG